MIKKNRIRNIISKEVRQQQLDELRSEVKLYTLTDLEPILGVSHLTLQRYIKDKKLTGVKIGNKWRVTHEELLRFIRERSSDKNNK